VLVNTCWQLRHVRWHKQPQRLRRRSLLGRQFQWVLLQFNLHSWTRRVGLNLPATKTSADLHSSICRPCDDAVNCVGINMPGGDSGMCMDGKFRGCSCASACGDHSGACSDNDCDGVDGTCTFGRFNGCPCDTSCGNLSPGPCTSGGCNGVVNATLGFGVCQDNFKGCTCTI
jgi:hypothetical protein